MGGPEVVAVIGIVIGASTVAILRGPLGKAIADRMTGKTAHDPDAAGQIDQLQSDLEDVKHRLSETEDRLDFAERLLAKQRQESLGPGK
jgi:hypothetical protein